MTRLFVPLFDDDDEGMWLFGAARLPIQSSHPLFPPPPLPARPLRSARQLLFAVEELSFAVEDPYRVAQVAFVSQQSGSVPPASPSLEWDAVLAIAAPLVFFALLAVKAIRGARGVHGRPHRRMAAVVPLPPPLPAALKCEARKGSEGKIERQGE